MSRSQRGRLIVLALPFLGRPTSPVPVHRGAVGAAAGHVALDHLAHVQHGQRVSCLRRSGHSSPAAARSSASAGRLKNEWALSPLRVSGRDRSGCAPT
jgi:uncharacterized Zn-binding protein involved in type VI secretion